MKIYIVLDIDSNDPEVWTAVDAALDSGALQDALDEEFADRDIDAEIMSALSTGEKALYTKFLARKEAEEDDE